MAGALPPICILAGGKGTRLGAIVDETPKPLVEVAGAPFLRHQLALLASHGAERIVLSVGYLGELIEAGIGDGADLGLDITYVYDSPRLDGTAGAIRNCLPQLGDRFMVLYGDTYLRIDYRAVDAAHLASGQPALMTVLRNEGAWDTSNVIYDDGIVVAYDKRAPTPEMHWIDYGLGVLTAEAMAVRPDASDLADLYTDLAQDGRLAGYLADQRFYEIGTPDALAETDRFLRALT
ncbi:MAG: nucleotidyltransferase family protein [Patulibacter minatonensis]